MKMVKDIFRRELIGREIEILSSSDIGLAGRRGVVVDETKNTLMIEEKQQIDTKGSGTKSRRQRIQRITVPKDNTRIKTTHEGKQISIDCSKICRRAQDRIKSR